MDVGALEVRASPWRFCSLEASEGIVSTAAGPHLGLSGFCFFHPKTLGKGLPGGGGGGA